MTAHAMPWKNPPTLAPSPLKIAAGIDAVSKAVLNHTAQAALAALEASENGINLVKMAEHGTLAPPTNFASMIDELGAVRDQIKKLKAREETIAEQVEALGVGEHDGTRCRAVVTTVTTMRLDTKSLTAVLPEELVKAHTKASVSVRVSIKALV